MELKNIVTELKNSLERFNSRLDQTEGRISQHKDKLLEIIQLKEQKEKKSEESLRNSWDITRWTNVCISRVPEEKRGRENGPKGLIKEIISENFPNLRKEMDIQIQEAKQTNNPVEMNPKNLH